MSVLGDIMSRIFRGSTLRAQPAEPAGAPESATEVPGAPASSGAAPAASAGTTARPSDPVDVEAVLSGLAARSSQRLDWRHSIVDLMKLLDLDSGLPARKQLAQELGYTGTLDGSAEMNLWLHRSVMRRLAENGGVVPDDLRD